MVYQISIRIISHPSSIPHSQYQHQHQQPTLHPPTSIANCTMSWVPDSVGVAYALATFVLIYSIPSLWSLVTGSWRVVKHPNHEALYEDEDGAATTESTKEFSNKTQFIIIFVVVVIGLALSIADFVFFTTRKLHILEGAPSGSGDDNDVLGIVLLVPAWVKCQS